MDKGWLLNEVVAVTGWSRDNARRRLAQAAKTRAAKPQKRVRARKYSYDALVVLRRVWAFSGGQCGKYMRIAMPALLDALERHGDLVSGKGTLFARGAR
jgi:hypothetical protein